MKVCNQLLTLAFALLVMNFVALGTTTAQVGGAGGIEEFRKTIQIKKESQDFDLNSFLIASEKTVVNAEKPKVKNAWLKRIALKATKNRKNVVNGKN